MANYAVKLTPDVVNLATEGSMDDVLVNGKSVQRTMDMLLVENGDGYKMVSRLKDGDVFDAGDADLSMYPNLVEE